MTHSSNALTTKLLSLADDIARFADSQTERLSFGEYADLMELETRLKSFAELFAARDPEYFLATELESARDHFDYIQSRLATVVES